jgi:hypothetical protein
MGYTSAVRKCIHIEIRKKFRLIHERIGLVTLYLLFVKDMVYPERLTISGIIDTSRKE